MEQFLQAFASRGFVSDSWAFLFISAEVILCRLKSAQFILVLGTRIYINTINPLIEAGSQIQAGSLFEAGGEGVIQMFL